MFKLLITGLHFLMYVVCNTYGINFIKYLVIAELPRAKRASGAPWVRKIGKPSSRENLVVTSPYERTSFVRPYRLLGRGGDSRVNPNPDPNGGAELRIPSFLNGIFKEKGNSCQFVVNIR